MIVKVCGIKNPENLIKVVDTKPNMIGLIFYKQSKRCVELNEEIVHKLSLIKTKKVGVFVDEEIEEIRKIIDRIGLDYAQVHGSENNEFREELSEFTKVIKAIRVKDSKDLIRAWKFKSCDFLLFDAKGVKPGGNGIRFNWSLLEEYKGETPFILSGGIRLSDLEIIKKINHPKMAGIDVNSGFEVEPGIKNIELIKELMDEIRREYI